MLGLRLRDYSLGHEILLLDRKNPLLTLSAGELAALPDPSKLIALREAVWTCANTWAQNHHERAVRFKVRLWSWLTSKANLALEIANFQSYLAAAYVRFPSPDPFSSEVANDENETGRGRSLGAPLLANLMLFAARNREALARIHPATTVHDLPLALISNLYLADMEAEGRLRVENHDEARVRLQMEQAKAEAIAEEQAEAAADTEHGTPNPELTPCPL